MSLITPTPSRRAGQKACGSPDGSASLTVSDAWGALHGKACFCERLFACLFPPLKRTPS